MAFPVTINGRTYTLADFEGTNYVDGFPDALEDFVTQAGDIYNSTSSSSVAIGTGSKTFTIADSGKPYQAGTPLRIADAAAPETNFMDCIVTSYSGTTLVVDSFGYAGSGTKTSWTVNIGGAKTVDGTLAVSQGGTGATTAAAARTALGVGTGDSPTFAGIDVTGTVTADGLISNVFGNVLSFNRGDTAVAGVLKYVDAATSFNMGTTTSHDFNLISADTVRLTVDSGGNVGIGTSSPSNVLHINDSNPTIRLEDSDGSGAGIAQVQNTASGNLRLIADPNNDAVSSTIEFEVDGSEAMRLDSSGNVGIGTTIPSEKLVIVGNALLTTGYKIYGNANTGLTSSYLSLYNAVDGGIDLMANYTTSKITFGTAGSERMRIDSSGNLLVGVTAPVTLPDNSVGGGVSMSTDGQLIAGRNNAAPASFKRTTSDGDVVTFHKDGSTVGSISVTSSTTTYNITSDQRLKDNIVDAPAGNVDDIKVRSFDWKADGSHQEYGMVAQELEAVAPYAVTKGETEDDMWSVDYSKLVPMLIKEIQDLKAEVAALKGA